MAATFLSPSGCGVTCLPGKMKRGQVRDARDGIYENQIQRNSEVTASILNFIISRDHPQLKTHTC